MNNIDTLTGLGNRQGLTEYIASRPVPTAASRTWMALFDIDRLILVNDQYGHVIGDKYLREMSKLLAATAKSQALAVFRVSGDEFAVIGTEMPHARFVWLMRKLQYSINKMKPPFRCLNTSRDRVTVSVSIGELTCSAAADVMSLVSVLDARLAKAKYESETLYNVFIVQDRRESPVS